MKKSELKQLIKEVLSFDSYYNALMDLKKELLKGNKSPLVSSRAYKDYYIRALKMGIDNKIIDNKTRLAINRHNKKIGKLDAEQTELELIIDGLNLVIQYLKK